MLLSAKNESFGKLGTLDNFLDNLSKEDTERIGGRGHDRNLRNFRSTAGG